MILSRLVLNPNDLRRVFSVSEERCHVYSRDSEDRENPSPPPKISQVPQGHNVLVYEIFLTLHVPVSPVMEFEKVPVTSSPEVSPVMCNSTPLDLTTIVDGDEPLSLVVDTGAGLHPSSPTMTVTLLCSGCETRARGDMTPGRIP